MKKICIVAFSLLMTVSLTLGAFSSAAVDSPDNVTLCDMDYAYVSI